MKPSLTLLTALLLAQLAALHAQSADPSSLQDALRQRQTKNATMNLPLPANLERRTLKVGDADREYFIHIAESVRGKPAPLIFALHGGASNSGLQMHYKVDFTLLAVTCSRC